MCPCHVHFDVSSLLVTCWRLIIVYSRRRWTGNKGSINTRFPAEALGEVGVSKDEWCSRLWSVQAGMNQKQYIDFLVSHRLGHKRLGGHPNHHKRQLVQEVLNNTTTLTKSVTLRIRKMMSEGTCMRRRWGYRSCSSASSRSDDIVQRVKGNDRSSWGIPHTMIKVGICDVSLLVAYSCWCVLIMWCIHTAAVVQQDDSELRHSTMMARMHGLLNLFISASVTLPQNALHNFLNTEQSCQAVNAPWCHKTFQS